MTHMMDDTYITNTMMMSFYERNWMGQNGQDFQKASSFLLVIQMVTFQGNDGRSAPLSEDAVVGDGMGWDGARYDSPREMISGARRTAAERSQLDVELQEDMYFPCGTGPRQSLKNSCGREGRE